MTPDFSKYKVWPTRPGDTKRKYGFSKEKNRFVERVKTKTPIYYRHIAPHKKSLILHVARLSNLTDRYKHKKHLTVGGAMPAINNDFSDLYQKLRRKNRDQYKKNTGKYGRRYTKVKQLYRFKRPYTRDKFKTIQSRHMAGSDSEE